MHKNRKVSGVKETFWGQITFPQDTCGGVVCPLFYLEIFTRTSIISSIITFTFSVVILVLKF